MGVDVDGTLADTHERWVKLANEKFGLGVKREQLKVYDFTRLLDITTPQMLGLFKDAWEDYRSIRLMHEDIPAILGRLRGKYSIHIITAGVGNRRDIIGWLDENSVPYDAFHHVRERSQKLRFRTALNLDDCGELAEEFASRGRGVVLLKQPWNSYTHRKLKMYDSARIAKDWYEVENIAVRLAPKPMATAESLD